MSSPSISLCLIAKNEEKNVQRLLDSVKGCFDQIVFVDTGSTDKTVEIAEKNGCEVHHFKWINDFSAARNFSFSKAKCDYIAWLDLDDELRNPDAFKHWRDTAMEFADCWFASYNYAVDKDRKPIISFVRERVFKRSKGPKFQYPIHEGIIIDQGWSRDYAVTWAVDHLRDEQDIKQDKSRNLKILEDMRSSGTLDARLQFYYGKELYEQGEPYKAIDAFDEALKNEALEPHDRLLSFQYGAYSCIQSADNLKDELVEQKNKLMNKALSFALDGIKLDPNRAEFWVLCGDIYLKSRQLVQAIPYYGAAKRCYNAKANGSPYEGAVYSFVDCYGLNPTLQLSKIYMGLGRVEEARAEATEAVEKYNSDEAKSILAELNRIADLTKLDNNQEEVRDIVFTCPPQTAYQFDEELYKTKAMGGSETALIQMAKYLKEVTGRPVKVFNMRDTNLTADSGVEYLSNKDLVQYMSKYKPAVHIAWRHNIKLTNAPSYLWCHDLVTPTVETKLNEDKILCLTNFHRDYVMAKQGVSADKIIVTRNGIPVEKFKFERKKKNPNKLLWMSSPDRGLDRAMYVCDEVRKEFPDIELHVYYGLENLYKYGLADLANRLKEMMAERPWVKYHGFTEQSQMYREVSDGVIWVHPCNFIETFCITALEMLELGVFPVTRSLGALRDTLREAKDKGMAVMLDHDCVEHSEVMAYANQVKKALKERSWENVKLDSEKHSWKSIAKEWVDLFNL